MVAELAAIQWEQAVVFRYQLGQLQEKSERRAEVLENLVARAGSLLMPSLLPSNVPLPYWGRRPPPLLLGGLLGNGRGWVRCHHPASLDAAVTLPKSPSLHGRWRAATNAARELACSSSKEEALGRFTTAARCHGVTAISRD